MKTIIIPLSPYTAILYVLTLLFNIYGFSTPKYVIILAKHDTCIVQRGYNILAGKIQKERGGRERERELDIQSCVYGWVEGWGRTSLSAVPSTLR